MKYVKLFMRRAKPQHGVKSILTSNFLESLFTVLEFLAITLTYH